MASACSISLRVTILAIAVVSLGSCQSLRKLGQIPAPHAGFASLAHKAYLTDHLARDTLVISSFDPIPLLGIDHIYEVISIGQHLNNLGSVTIKEVTHSFTWPNEVSQVPDKVFNGSVLVIAAGGFLVPFKDHGSLTLFDLDIYPPAQYVVSNNGEDAQWFYHRVEWMDVNHDGLLDIVTCRAKKPLLGGGQGELVWFEHPHQNALTHAWQSHVIANHDADVFFAVTSLPTSKGAVTCIVTAGFFSHTLAVFWSEHPQGRWDDPSQIHSRVIDHGIGAVFDVIVTDVNKDGKLDLLVTNNALHNASLFAYTVPADFRTGNFQRHILHSGYTSRTQGIGHGAPGSPLLVYSQTNHVTQKPWIIVSGDDDGRAYLLKPASNATSDWSYQQTSFLDVGTSTVGGIAVGDVNNDGYNEVFVPSFTEGLVHVFTFKP